MLQLSVLFSLLSSKMYKNCFGFTWEPQTNLMQKLWRKKLVPKTGFHTTFIEWKSKSNTFFFRMECWHRKWSVLPIERNLRPLLFSDLSPFFLLVPPQTNQHTHFFRPFPCFLTPPPLKNGFGKLDVRLNSRDGRKKERQQLETNDIFFSQRTSYYTWIWLQRMSLKLVSLLLLG